MRGANATDPPTHVELPSTTLLEIPPKQQVQGIVVRTPLPQSQQHSQQVAHAKGRENRVNHHRKQD
jgi:hypothetical protein